MEWVPVHRPQWAHQYQVFPSTVFVSDCPWEGAWYFQLTEDPEFDLVVVLLLLLEVRLEFPLGFWLRDPRLPPRECARGPKACLELLWGQSFAQWSKLPQIRHAPFDKGCLPCVDEGPWLVLPRGWQRLQEVSWSLCCGWKLAIS